MDKSISKGASNKNDVLNGQHIAKRLSSSDVTQIDSYKEQRNKESYKRALNQVIKRADSTIW